MENNLQFKALINMYIYVLAVKYYFCSYNRLKHLAQEQEQDNIMPYAA